MRINADLLASLANQVFDLGMDGRLSSEQVHLALALGKRLRGAWVNLVTAEFKQATPLFTEASKALDATNERLREAKESIDKIADALKMAATLLEILDRLLVTAVKFL